MVTSKIGKPSGILNQRAGETKFQLSRYAPAQDLSLFVQRYWMVQWNLQAHFIKDFKMIVGRTPAEYARNLGSAKL
jgi:hypothetical protein